MTDLAGNLATLSVSADDQDTLLARHRRERKDLQAQVQALKKSAGSDKKRKREAQLEIAALEAALDARHERELFESSKRIAGQSPVEPVAAEQPPATEDDEQAAGEPQQQRVSKAQKRRDRKAQADRELQAEISAQEELNKTGERAVENQAIEALLGARGLRVHHVQSDGDCLYNAVRHELLRTGRPELAGSSANALRSVAADYIAANYGELIAYMTHPRTGECLSDVEFRAYCEAVRNKRSWGGQLEVKALSNALRVRIEVLQASGPATVQDEGDFGGEALLLTYHRHMYSLGEHYNATSAVDAERERQDAEFAGAGDD